MPGVAARAVDILNRLSTFRGTNVEEALEELAACRAKFNPTVGNYFGPIGNSAGAVVTLSRLYFLPIELCAPTPIDRIGARVTTGGAGSTIRLGVYQAAASGAPGALLFEAPGTLDGNSVAAQEITLYQILPPGRLYVAGVAQGGVAPQLSLVANTAVPTLGFRQTFTSGVGPTNTGLGWTQVNHGVFYQDTVAGALPAVATPGYDTTVTSGIGPYMRAA